MPTVRTKNKQKINTSRKNAIESLRDEVRLLRNEVSLLLPQDNLAEYEHANRVSASYRKALKEHPST